MSSRIQKGVWYCWLFFHSLSWTNLGSTLERSAPPSCQASKKEKKSPKTITAELSSWSRFCVSFHRAVPAPQINKCSWVAFTPQELYLQNKCAIERACAKLAIIHVSCIVMRNSLCFEDTREEKTSTFCFQKLRCKVSYFARTFENEKLHPGCKTPISATAEPFRIHRAIYYCIAPSNYPISNILHSFDWNRIMLWLHMAPCEIVQWV